MIQRGGNNLSANDDNLYFDLLGISFYLMLNDWTWQQFGYKKNQKEVNYLINL